MRTDKMDCDYKEECEKDFSKHPTCLFNDICKEDWKAVLLDEKLCNFGKEEFQTQYMCEFKLEAPLLLCTASYDHARYFVRHNLAPETRWNYIHEPLQLKGMRDCTLLFVGDYWRAANLHDIEFEAKVSRMTVRYV